MALKYNGPSMTVVVNPYDEATLRALSKYGVRSSVLLPWLLAVVLYGSCAPIIGNRISHNA